MNAKVVFIVEINARNEMFFYCLLQIKYKLFKCIAARLF
jgi:hypothetical protein